MNKTFPTDSECCQNPKIQDSIQWHPAITNCHGTEINVRCSEDPVIMVTNCLVNNKNIRYSGVTKLNNGIYTTQNSVQQASKALKVKVSLS